MRAGKIISHSREGQGKLSAHRLTVMRPGPLGDHNAGKAADMFVDPMPYLSLRGIDTERSYNRRGNTMRAVDESHIQHRTKGKHRGTFADGRHHQRGGLVTKE